MSPRRASGPLVLGLAQVNPTVGDLAGNLRLIADVVADARHRDVGVLVLPEMVVSGYPPEDLLLREDFLADCRVALTRVAAMSDDMPILCGFPERTENDVFNALAVCSGGEVVGVYHKAYLPNYGVFDERRYHSAPDPREAARLIRVDGRLVGLTICEDIWYPGPPLSDETLAGAELVVNVSASPYRVDVARRREEMIATRCRDNLCAIAYCNLVGGQDELVFDGASMVVDHEGRVTARAPQFVEHLLVTAVDSDAPRAARLRDTRYRQVPREREVPVIAEVSSRRPATGRRGVRTPPADAEVPPLLDREAEVYAALTLGVRDYVAKSGFGHVVVGLSGGVDSALVATVAADALGPQNVTAVVMPSPHSSRETQDDARRLARGLGVELREIPIAPLMDAYREALAPQLRGVPGPDVTEENIQARIRGNLLMALSNRFSWLLLTTGNKSEMSVGYATLYGDMAGGFAVVKDVPKQMVFALARWRNRDGEVIPRSIIDRPPSAELRPDQLDTDSLPPYDVLDPVLALYVEEDESPSAIVAAGMPEEVVGRVVGLVDRAEYKRRQAPPGIKITARAFGRDRRMPVVNRYRAGMLGEVPPEHPPAAARDAEAAARREGFDGSAAAARQG